MCKHEIKGSSFDKNRRVFKTCNKTAAHESIMVREVVFVVIIVDPLFYNLYPWC